MDGKLTAEDLGISDITIVTRASVTPTAIIHVKGDYPRLDIDHTKLRKKEMRQVIDAHHVGMLMEISMNIAKHDGRYTDEQEKQWLQVIKNLKTLDWPDGLLIP